MTQPYRMVKETSKTIENGKLATEPSRNILQTLAAVMYINCMMVLIFVFMFLTPILAFYLNHTGRVIFLLYLVYIYFDNLKRHSAIHGNGWLIFRKNTMANHFRDYFPIELIKTAELHPSRNYLLASFPHGIACTGIANNMAYNIDKWLKLFPGVRPKIATISIYFYIPIFREILRLWGFVSCTKESLTYYLSKSSDPEYKDNRDGFTSNAVAILVGGIKEALDSQPGRYILTLKNRKGFVKLAINTGSAIVPTFSFGEVDIFEPVETSLESFFNKFQNNQLVFVSRILKYSLSVLPKRKHIVQVVGAPIEVIKMCDPSPKYVDDIHQKVIESLNEMFNKYKHEYIENADDIKLIIN